jgi:hypothetical protein
MSEPFDDYTRELVVRLLRYILIVVLVALIMHVFVCVDRMEPYLSWTSHCSAAPGVGVAARGSY